MHNTNPSQNARDIYEYHAREADRTARAIASFAFEYCSHAYKVLHEANEILAKTQELINA